MKYAIATLAMLALVGAGAIARAESATGHQVLIAAAGPAHGGFLLAPDPVVIGRDRPAPAHWRLDPAARRAAARFQVRFEPTSPFAGASASGPAEATLTLGPLRPPLELGSSSYAVALFDAAGQPVGEARGTVVVRESAGLPRWVLLLAGALGLALLLANYLDSRVYTRTYEH